jgi:cell division septum initiation protein DivIVA
MDAAYARLFGDAFVLWEAFQLARADEELKRNVALVYLVDPSIAELYLEPRKWDHQQVAFPSLSSVGGARGQKRSGSISIRPKADVLGGTALLTGEHMFSRDLVGQLDQLYLTPDHGIELFAYLDKVEWKYSKVLAEIQQTLEDAPQLADQIAQTVRGNIALERAGIMTRKEARNFEGLVTRALGRAARAEMLTASRLHGLLDSGVLSNIAGRQDFTEDVAAPRVRDVAEWAKLIRTAKASNRVLSSASAIDADAVSLEQVWLLNQETKSRRFLMITNDEGLHSAYRTMLATREGVRFYALRRPIQYSPVFRLRESGESFDGLTLVQDIEAAVELIVQTFNSSEETEPGDVIHVLSGSRSMSANSRILHDELVHMAEGITRDWNKVVAKALTSKADVLSKVAAQEENFWLALVTSRVFRSEFEGVVRNFNNEALSLSASSSLLRHEIWALRAAADDAVNTYDDFSRRRLASDFHAFESPTLAGRALPAVVADWMEAGPAAMDDLKAVAIVGERLLCAGALCLEIGAWNGAHRLFKESLKTQDASPASPGGGTALQRESQFFLAVAARLAAGRRSWERRHEEARRALGKLSAQRRQMSVYEIGRLESESIASALCRAPWIFDQDGRAGRISREIDEIEAHAVAFLEERLPDLLREDDRDFVRAVIKQICLNLHCLVAWGALVRGSVAPRAATLAAQADRLFELPWMSEFASGPHTECYPRLSAFARMDDGPARQALAEDVVLRMSSYIKRDDEYGFAFDLPTVDKLEFRQMQQWVEATVGRIKEQ